MFGKKLFGQKASEQPTPQSTMKTRNRTPSLKQKKFVEGVIQHGNASKAARDAGYSERSARVLACRNLKRPDIQAQIKSRIESAEIDTNEIIGTLVGHMRADIANLLADDGSLDLAGAIENGSTQMIKKLIIRKRPIKGITDERGDPIEETTYDIVIHDSQLAAWRLARILHLEVKNRPPEARRPTDDELAHRMADLLERARANGRREGAAAQRPAQTTESHSYNVSTAGQNKQSALPPRPTMIVPDMTTTDQTDQSRPRLQKQPSDIKARDNQASITSGRITQGFASGRADGRGAESYLDPVEKLPGGSSEPGILGALSQVPIRNGLWNRIFAGAPTLTFINS